MPLTKAALLALPLLLSPLLAQADPVYSVNVLGTVGANYSYASGINDAGQVAVTVFPPNEAGRYAMLYSGGTLTDLGSLGGSVNGAFGINAGGDVVGFSTTAAGTEHGFLYANGSMHDLGTLGGANSAAAGINDAGQAVGFSETASGGVHAFLYSYGSLQDLQTLGGRFSDAVQVNNAGQIAGSSTLQGDRASHAFLYAGGTMTDLGTLGGSSSFSSAINASGQVVGSSVVDPFGGNYFAFLYANGVMTNLGTIGGTGDASDALGINDLGEVVGRSYANNAERGFLYVNGVMTDLNTLIDPASGWTILEAADINNSGQIAAYGYKDGVGYRALRLDLVSNVPEPGSAAMLLAGFGMLGAVARRRRKARRG